MINLLDSRWFMANISESDRAAAIGRDYRRDRRSVWVWCLALSLALHVALLAAWPGSFEARGTFTVRALDVVLMPETLVAPAPVLAPRAVPQRRTIDAAEMNNAPVRRERTTESRRVPDAVPQRPPAIAAAESSSATEPLAAARVPAKPGDDAYPAIARKPQDAAAGRIANDVSAPSFNAAYLRNPAPLYPIIARRNGEQGTVTLKVLVTREGTPASVSVDKTSGSAHLDAAALEAVRSWRFAPARQGTQPVEAWVLVPIVFRLEPAS